MCNREASRESQTENCAVRLERERRNALNFCCAFIFNLSAVRDPEKSGVDVTFALLALRRIVIAFIFAIDRFLHFDST